MAEVSKKRHHWPWILLVIGILLVLSPIAWQLRPLNQTERSLIGNWKPDELSRTAHPDDRITLTGDRRFVWRMATSTKAMRTPSTIGSWSASIRFLTFELDSTAPTPVMVRIREGLQRVFGQDSKIRFNVTFDPDGSLRLSNTEFTGFNDWRRAAPDE